MENKKQKVKRSTKLIADFEDGYALGWRFCVNEVFKDALDIKKTARVIKGKQLDVWTQGKNFSFKEGDLIHDVRSSQTWGEMLKSIQYSVQVKSASPASDGAQGTNENPGSVNFQLFEKSSDKSKMVPIKTYECSQASFIRFLQEGKLTLKEEDVLILKA
jgi:hypothetical protein